MINGESYSESEDSFSRYDLSQDEAYQLTANLIKERAENLPENSQYITFEINGDDKYSNIGRYIERAVFEEAFGNDAEEMDREYGPYDSVSRFFISVDSVNSKPVGVIRVIQNSPAGLKTLNDVRNEPFNLSTDKIKSFYGIDDLNQVWDIGTIAALPENIASKGISSIQLYRATYMSAIKHNVKHWVSVVDDMALKMMKTRFGLPFEPLADSEPAPYLGSDKSYAVYAYVPDFYEKMSVYMSSKTSPLGRIVMKNLVLGNDDESIILGR